MKVFIVIGDCQDRQDCDEWWQVAVYTSKEAAEKHCEMARSWWRENRSRFRIERWQGNTINGNPWDPSQRAAFLGEGTSWDVYECLLWDHPDQFIEALEKQGK